MRLLLFCVVFLAACTCAKIQPQYYAIYEQHHITGKIRRTDFEDVYQRNVVKLYRDSVVYNGASLQIKRVSKDHINQLYTYWFQDGTKMVVYWKATGTIILYYRKNNTIVRMTDNIDDL